MRIGVFSDVHGNIYAFEKVWRALQKEKADVYVFCGDICGYYYYQNEIIDILKKSKNLIAVRGNHDDLFLKMLNNKTLEKKYESKYSRANSLLKKTITKASLSFLRKLPKKYILKEQSIAVFHGSPKDHLDGYIYPLDPITKFKELKYRFVLLGHTHYPMDRTINKVRIINPGSCGQPRDYNKPSFAVLDTRTGEVKFKRVSYDPGRLIRDVQTHGEKNNYLINVLKRKKKNG